ncbi:3TM-type holin [Pseudoalteromonas sp. T1lg65]|uniref:3TM-type holin n=1 Tax=Pseudoalteromonas sp. T1lg65 TaxID=2077101 RepID=UPI003F7ACF32
MTDWLGISSAIGNLVDDLHTSDEEKIQLKNEATRIENIIESKRLELESKRLDLEAREIEAKAKVVTAESKGHSFLQRNWRPITMLTFLVLIVCDSFGLLAFRLSAEAWALLETGLQGYVVGRTIEKIAPGAGEKMKEIAKSVFEAMRTKKDGHS